MADFTERIKIIIDATVDGAKSGFASLKTDIAEAEGVGGKFKAGMTNVFDSVKANAGAMAIGAGGALVAFGIKAVGAFTDIAKAALDLSTSSGLAVEDASRWIAVGDDFQIGADTLTVSIGKIAKSLDDNKWAKYGIDTRDAGGKARDVNDILLDSLTKLSSITDETERTRVGNVLFGKGYAALSPLIGHTREEYVKMLGAVEDGQVITADEAAKAEKWRLAEDDLKDALHNVTLNIGQQVAALAPLLEGLAKYVAFTEKLQGTPAGTLPFLDDLGKVKAGWDAVFGHAADDVDGVANASGRSAAAFAETDRQIKLITDSAYDEAGAIADTTAALDAAKAHAKSMADDTKRGLDEISGRWDALTGNINDDKTWANLQTGFDDLKVKVDEAWKAAGDGAVDSEQKTRDARVAIDDQKLAVIQYAQEVLKVPLSMTTRIIAAIDSGDLEQAEKLLANLTRNRNADVFIVSHGGAGYGPNGVPRATGGPASGWTTTDEMGREAIFLPDGSRVLAASQTANRELAAQAAGDTVTIVNHWPPGLNPAAVAKAQRDYRRRGGR